MVTVTGSGFTAGSTVAFGTTPATSVTVTNATTLAATSPAVPAGAVDRHRDHGRGHVSATSAADLFTYDSVPTRHRHRPDRRARWPAAPRSPSPGPASPPASTVAFGGHRSHLGERHQHHHA